MITEFGGIAYSREPGGTWGYARAEDPEDFGNRYARLLQAIRSLPSLAGFCYTQFADTYQEANGLLYADRTPKRRWGTSTSCASAIIPAPSVT